MVLLYSLFLLQLINFIYLDLQKPIELIKILFSPIEFQKKILHSICDTISPTFFHFSEHNVISAVHSRFVEPYVRITNEIIKSTWVCLPSSPSQHFLQLNFNTNTNQNIWKLKINSRIRPAKSICKVSLFFYFHRSY